MTQQTVSIEQVLPEGMEYCTIRFIACEQGHGRLLPTTWIDYGCPHCEIERLTAELARAIAALQALVDWQNGPPLETPKWLDGWGGAMRQAEAVLKSTTEAGKEKP